jgi:serralysin
MVANPNRYCICIPREGLPSDDLERLKGQRAAVLKDAKWDIGAEIKISFLEGSQQLRDRVRRYAEQWIGKDMANLRFLWIDGGPADLRIAFRQGHGSWSYLGTVSRRITDQSRPTMNYGWLTDASGEDEVKRVVLHEFGHAIGLIHEHQNPKGGVRWNEEAVINDLKGPPNNWNIDQIHINVLNHYDPDAVQASALDPHSIMMYPIPNSWTIGDFSTGLNSDLTETDRRIVREAYP